MVMVEKEESKVDFSSLEVMARLTETNIEAREICDKWLLITYDIPHNEAGDKARAQFLQNAKAAGASMYTESVYLMPWTKEAEMLALQLARAGEVCVWTAQTTDVAKAAEITRNYDSSLSPRLDEISGRIDKISAHLEDGHQGRAYRMIEKTEKMLWDIEAAIIRRGSAQLYVMLTLIKRRFETLG